MEIVIEKDKGWGAGLAKDTWYGRIVGEQNPVMKLLAKFIGIPYFFGGLILIYFLVIPGILALEYFFILPNLPLLAAVYLAILVVEDFSWFLLNWHFPALRELLKGPHGTIWWHRRWVKICNGYYLPLSYFLPIPLITVLLYLT